jgi:hypothetical protein
LESRGQVDAKKKERDKERDKKFSLRSLRPLPPDVEGVVGNLFQQEAIKFF